MFIVAEQLMLCASYLVSCVSSVHKNAGRQVGLGFDHAYSRSVSVARICFVVLVP